MRLLSDEEIEKIAKGVLVVNGSKPTSDKEVYQAVAKIQMELDKESIRQLFAEIEELECFDDYWFETQGDRWQSLKKRWLE